MALRNLVKALDPKLMFENSDLGRVQGQDETHGV